MAIASTTVFEVDAATGDDTNNAGAFNPNRAGAGTDYSLTSPIAFSDLAAPTTTTVTSATIGFTSDHVGNHLRIVSGTGWTAGLYEIVSVSSGTATVDRAIATASSTGGTGRLGGALASPGQAAAFWVIGHTGATHVKAGTYVIGTTANASGGRVNSNGGKLLGYQTTRGDLGTKPVFRSGGNSYTMVTQSITGAMIVSNIRFERDTGSGHTSVRGIQIGSAQAAVHACEFADLNNTGLVLSGATPIVADCEFVACNIGINPASCAGISIARCVIRNCTSTGINVGSSPGLSMSRCVLAGNAGSGISIDLATNRHRIYECTFYDNGASGYVASGSGSVESCLFVDNSDYGISLNTGTVGFVIVRGNAGYNNGLGNINTTDAAYFMEYEAVISLSADPFTDAASLDFSLNNAAGGGALLKGSGYPASFPGLLGTSYPDIGAYQSESGGGPSGPTYFLF